MSKYDPKIKQSICGEKPYATQDQLDSIESVSSEAVGHIVTREAEEGILHAWVQSDLGLELRHEL